MAERIPGLIDISEEDAIGREPTSVTIRKETEANTVKDGYALIPDSIELLADSVVRAFRSGDNIAYQFYKRFQREWLSPPPDPTFNAEDFIARNRKAIPRLREAQFRLAASQGEANLILQNMQQELMDQEVLIRRAGRSAEYRQPIF